ncbi:MAG: Rne/Rng family ribonuclease [Phycisphaerae bacterium]
MLINVVEGEEVRIAIVRKGLLEELYMERSSAESHVGNIYKGRVTNVEPSIQAAFVDFGLGKNGFLHISDLHPQYFSKQYLQKQGRPMPQRGGPRPNPAVVNGGNGGGGEGNTPGEQTSGAANPGEEGSLPVGATNGNGPAEGDGQNGNGSEMPVQVQEAGSGTATEPPGGVYGSGDMPEEMEEYDVDDGGVHAMERVGRKTPRRERPPIQQCLRRGQEVIVQVTKEGIGTKGPTLTTYISCPGRYLVMMPGMSQLGVSRKIEDETQRRELRKLLEELNPPRNLGFIIRTAGLDQTKKELQGDLNYLVRMWKVIAARIRSHKAPVELYQESDLIIRTIRDVFNNEIDRIVVDNEQVASRIRDFLSIVNPRSAGVVELYTGTLPVFQKYNVEREIEKIHAHRVEMANGGSLVIDSTEALVAIDVNSGRYREQRDPELSAFNMNKEAVKEVVRQLRLRDLGGVIVIDFIDMREERHKREIERLLRDEMKDDRAKTKVLRMSQFCMVELTRQRVRPSLKRSIYQDCPHCHGTALIKTPESVSLDVMRRLAGGATRLEVARIEVKVYPTVATYLLNRKRKQLVDLEDKTGKRINITADATLAGDGIVLEAYDARASLLNLVL